MYANAKIYRMVCGELTYYGSTTQSLAERKAKHKASYRCWKKGVGKNYTTSFMLYEIGDPVIVLVEDCPCERKEQVHARERYYIENNECVNKFVTGRQPHEFPSNQPEVRKAHNTAYYAEHKEKQIEKQKTKYECVVCGKTLRTDGKAYHERTKFHLARIG